MNETMKKATLTIWEYLHEKYPAACWPLKKLVRSPQLTQFHMKRMKPHEKSCLAWNNLEKYGVLGPIL